jgi:hypothetical protein
MKNELPIPPTHAVLPTPLQEKAFSEGERKL